MKILLVGEFSRLHNTLKEGLLALGHEVTLISNGDGFKNYPSDYNYGYRWFKKKLLNIPRQIINRAFGYDIAKLENAYRFKVYLKNLTGYDIIQFINEAPIGTFPSLEKKLLQQLIKQNGKAFLLCSGIDHTIINYLLERHFRYSLIDPWLNNQAPKSEYTYMLDYLSPSYTKLHNFLYANIEGVIASDMDYYIPLKDTPGFMGLIANPINLNTLDYKEPVITDKIIIFLGINRWAYHKKGIPYFEAALEIIKKKYPDKVEIIIAESLPYADYINKYNNANIMLDQVYAYDQGYNALEAMAKGKVVFTGAETEFMEYYGLTEPVAVNALPDATAIAKELAYLIENPNEIRAIGKRARTFIEKEHDYIKIASKYIETWLSKQQL